MPDVWEVPNLSAEQLAAMEDMEKVVDAGEYERTYNRLAQFRPYEKQLVFFDLGRTKKERMLNAGNRLGKSEAGAAEVTYHLTGKYPIWWTGRRWERPIAAWACGLTAPKTMEISQGKLCGDPSKSGALGTGFIPKADISDTILGRGTTGAFATVLIQHYDAKGNKDGISKLMFKSYEQGWQKAQGEGIDLIWLDEEPDDYKFYTECQARLMDTGGMMFITFTPLSGETELYSSFQGLSPNATEADKRAFAQKGFVNMTGDDVLGEPDNHFEKAAKEKAKSQGILLTPAQLKEAARQAYDDDINSFPYHERAARRSGRPIFGSGAVFPFTRQQISCDPIHDPGGFVTGGIGIDFGGAGGSTQKFSHFSAAVFGTYDRMTDVIYIIRAARVPGGDWSGLADAIRRMSSDAIVFWPHDGHRHGQQGETTAGQIKKMGINMYGTHATFRSGGYDTENGILEMHERFQSGRLKVCDNLTEWWSEYVSYGRKEDGEINKVKDDLMSATRILVMMLPRYGRTFRLGMAPPTGWTGPAGGSRVKRWTPDTEYFGID